MKIVSFIVITLSLCSIQAQNSCTYPEPATLNTWNFWDSDTDNALTADCEDVLLCTDPAYDYFWSFSLAAGPYLMHIGSASGFDSAYIGVMDTNCDTAYGEYCGSIPAEFEFTVPRTGTYHITINTVNATQFAMQVVPGDQLPSPYSNPLCPLVGIDPAIYPLDSIPVLKVGRITMYQVSQAGKVIGYRRYWE